MKKKNRYNVAVLGATGAVGQEMLSILEERRFPVDRLTLLASGRSAGKTCRVFGREIAVEQARESSFEGVDIVLASAGGAVSKKLAPSAVRAGAVVIDNTSAFRMDPGVPLVVPEINAAQIRRHKGIIANPNCSTIILLVPVYPIHRLNPVRRILVSTYQSASGAGARAMRELEEQSRDVLAGRPARKEVFPHPIAFNLFSHNSRVEANGYNEEEMKMIRESRKILGAPRMRITATTVRVPVFRAHSETIYLELSRKPDVAAVRRLLAKAPGVRLVDDRDKNVFPMPLDAAGHDEILVGRIREDVSCGRGLCLFVAGDQLRKGAALNAVQIAEILVSRPL